jgi:hypothetical protein
LCVGSKLLREDFDRDLAIEARIDGAIDVPHASGGDGRDYFVGTQPGARGQRRDHDAANYSWGTRIAASSLVSLSGTGHRPECDRFPGPGRVERLSHPARSVQFPTSSPRLRHVKLARILRSKARQARRHDGGAV